jgi:hypothetical protein
MNRTVSLVTVCFLVALFGAHGFAQRHAEPPTLIREVPLEPPSDSVRMRVVASGLVGTSQCDADGGVYIRPDAMMNPLQVPIMRVHKDKQPLIFDIGPAPKDTENYIHAFAVDPRGEVAALVRTVFKNSVIMTLVSFRSDGTMLDRVPLDSEIVAIRMAALPKEEILISGFEELKRTNDKGFVRVYGNRGFVHIYGRDGRFKRSLYEQAKPSNEGANYDLAIQFGSTQVGPDGTIYILKGTKPATLEVFTPEGARIATHKLVPPFKDAQSFDLHLASARAIVQYQRSATLEKNREPEIRMDYTVYDLMTGEPQVNLVSTKPGMMVCVVQNEMIYLIGGKDGFLSLGKRPLP